MTALYLPAGTVVNRVGRDGRLDPVELVGDAYVDATRNADGTCTYTLGNGRSATTYVVGEAAQVVQSAT